MNITRGHLGDYHSLRRQPRFPKIGASSGRLAIGGDRDLQTSRHQKDPNITHSHFGDHRSGRYPTRFPKIGASSGRLAMSGGEDGQ